MEDRHERVLVTLEPPAEAEGDCECAELVVPRVDDRVGVRMRVLAHGTG